MLLQSVDRPGRHAVGGRDQRDLVTLAAQLLREYATEIVVVVVEHDHGSRRGHSVEQIVGREHTARQIESGYGASIGASNSISTPARAGGEYHARCAEFQNFVGHDAAAAEDFDVLHFVQLIHPVISYTRPSRESW